MADVAVADIIESACAAVAPAAAQKGVELGCEMRDGAEVIPGDRQQLDRVMLNLISNAVKFTPPGGSVLASSRREGDEIVVSVTDTGIGIPEDEQQMLFTRFFRASNVRAAASGSGLGLAIAHRIVEHHGGSLSVTSREGAGTTFRVRLPLQETAVAR
jgi:signal transduction histidine kinase